MARSVFIAATGQHVGKTTTCLGLVGGLTKRVQKPGFIKPVGQQHVLVPDGSKVDIDVDLIRTQFSLNHLAHADMSPIVFDSMYTRDFLDGETESLDSMKARILRSYEKVSASSDFTVIEGTGHMGVGSIVGMNNATVAKLLDVDVVLVASGGIGSAFDELALNLQLCQAIGVRVRGIILNKVQPHKMEKVAYYVSKALLAWKVKLLGCIPFHPMLSSPSLSNLQSLLDAEVLAGADQLHLLLSERLLVATRSDIFYDALHRRGIHPATLIITPAARSDVINASIVTWTDNPDLRGALLLTGTTPPSREVQLLLAKANVPTIYSNKPTLQVAHLISAFTPKAEIMDKSRIEATIKLVEESLDLDDFF
ncbi:Phosphate acetyltransferase [Diplonema papillatum]|nr:Phosphate acetyltransferase [Diplonema papillatum]|eukprot:gene7721-11861_t